MSRNLFRRKVLPTIGALGAIVLLLGATACSGKSDDSASKTVTLWVASPTEAFTQALVTKYNATHENKVELTAIPDDGFLQKVGSAAGAKSLPDILVSDVVYMPNYTSQHILLDITDRINALPYANALAPSHIANGTWQNKKYGVPHKLASSVLFYNKDLFTKAGLDPQKPPTNFDEMLADARAIHAIGPNVYGFDFGGNCGGCTEYTMFPTCGRPARTCSQIRARRQTSTIRLRETSSHSTSSSGTRVWCRPTHRRRTVQPGRMRSSAAMSA